MDPQLLAEIAIGILCLGAGILIDFIFIQPRAATARQTPVAHEVHSTPHTVPLERPHEHVHDWKMSSAEQTAGKHVHVYVCYEHDQPAIERREIGTVVG